MIGEMYTLGWFIVAAFFVYLLYVTVRRAMGDGDDPAASLSAQSDTGSFSFLLSGTYLIAAVVLMIAGLTWPSAVEYPVFGILLVGIVMIHFVIERRESS